MVEGTCLENKRASNGTVGSNPTLSANFSCLLVMRRGTQVAEGDGLLNR